MGWETTQEFDYSIMFLPQKPGPRAGSSCWIAARLSSLSQSGMTSLLSTVPRLLLYRQCFRSSWKWCINTLTQSQPQITTQRGQRVTHLDPRQIWLICELSFVQMFKADKINIFVTANQMVAWQGPGKAKEDEWWWWWWHRFVAWTSCSLSELYN